MVKWLVLAVLLFSGCSIHGLDQTDGVVWETPVNAPIVCGVEKQGNKIYCADQEGSIYAIWVDSGMISWKRTLSNEKVIAIYPSDESLYVISSNTERQLVRQYDSEAGMIISMKSLGQSGSAGYLSENQKRIIDPAKDSIYGSEYSGSNLPSLVQTLKKTSLSPVYYSERLMLQAIVDQEGNLNIIDQKSGNFICSKYIGKITISGLSIKEDDGGKTVFIPVSSPSKITCYSVEFASHQKKPF